MRRASREILKQLGDVSCYKLRKDFHPTALGRADMGERGAGDVAEGLGDDLLIDGVGNLEAAIGPKATQPQVDHVVQVVRCNTADGGDAIIGSMTHRTRGCWSLSAN